MRCFPCSAVCLALTLSGGLEASWASATEALTADDYARAERFQSYNTDPLVTHSVEVVTWLSNAKFVYRTTDADGAKYVLMEPVHYKIQPLFNETLMASAISASSGEKIDANRLRFKSLEISENALNVTFDIGSERFSCDTRHYHCDVTTKLYPDGVLSPDKNRIAFLRDYNLWVRELTSGKETQLTEDGTKDFGYAVGTWRFHDRYVPVANWSPDSRKFATFKVDQRNVSDMYEVRTTVGHPKLESWKFPLPGDEIITTIQRVVIDIDKPRVIPLNLPPSSFGLSKDGGPAEVQWSADSSHLAIVTDSRDYKHTRLQIADTETGTVRNVLDDEISASYSRENWRYLPTSNEVIWYSPQDNWGHLYLRDLATGRVKNKITNGDWNVSRVVDVDQKNREVYFLGSSDEASENPYFESLYKIRFDGTHLKRLTPERSNHVVSLSPDHGYVVDTYSTPQTPPVTVLRDRRGHLLRVVEKADISALTEIGWRPPMTVKVKARDGSADLYGLLYTPAEFDETKKYPIINWIYPGPQIGSVWDWGFNVGKLSHPLGSPEALAELGFVVVAINGMGTPPRSRAFREANYGNVIDGTLPDQIAGMKELARTYPWIDLERAGILGHSGGGRATVTALFRYPDFFKVGVALAGDHDMRGHIDDWPERWMGALERKPDGSTNYDSQANQAIAKDLKGHLLLAHGTLDDNVPPYMSLLVADALIKANKDFDLLLLPNQRHVITGAAHAYMIRRTWDYFVRYLLGAEPPREYELHMPKGYEYPYAGLEDDSE